MDFKHNNINQFFTLWCLSSSKKRFYFQNKWRAVLCTHVGQIWSIVVDVSKFQNNFGGGPQTVGAKYTSLVCRHDENLPVRKPQGRVAIEWFSQLQAAIFIYCQVLLLLLLYQRIHDVLIRGTFFDVGVISSNLKGTNSYKRQYIRFYNKIPINIQ